MYWEENKTGKTLCFVMNVPNQSVKFYSISKSISHSLESVAAFMKAVAKETGE
jgi:hypothetical protein